MKFRYKRFMIVCCAFTMIVGMLVMSVAEPKKDNNDAEYNENIERAKTTQLEKDKYSKVNDLIRNYLDSEVKCDVENLALYVNDINQYSFEELQKKFSYVEYFDNISCYTIDGYYDNTYVVYVYREYKMKGIDTLIPSIVQNYVCENNQGNLVVYSGDVVKEVKDFIKATEENKSVLELIDVVNNKLEQVKDEDESVKSLLNQLDEVTGSVESGEYEASSKPESTDAPKATDKAKATNKAKATDKAKATNKAKATKKPDDKTE